MTSRGGTVGTSGSWRGNALAPREEIWDAGGSYLAVAKLRLEVIEGHDAGASRVFGRERIVIGSHDSADFVVRDSTVSRMHCELIPTTGRVVVRDLESKNGTAIHGMLVREVALTRTAVLELGHTKIRMSVGNDAAYLPLYDGDRLGPLVGQSAAMRRAFALAEIATGSDASVLIDGEAGTGKRTAAATIHERSARADRPLLVLACATPRDLLESELFGHDGAAARPGVFEAACGGSVLLDQVGELPIELQSRLLGILERREVRRIGGERAIPVDVRVMATTGRNLAAGINGHRFRSDLHARLAAIQIALPPLRARLDDLPLLVADHATRLQLDAEDRGWLVSPALAGELAMHHWPGNLCELQSYLEGCVALRARGVPGAIEATGSEPTAIAVDTRLPFHAARRPWMDQFDRSYAIALLREHRGNIAAAARAAGLDQLALYHLLWRLGIR
jgi:transcriptional regulator with GAF, ATPase, and Fis domain